MSKPLEKILQSNMPETPECRDISVQSVCYRVKTGSCDVVFQCKSTVDFDIYRKCRSTLSRQIGCPVNVILETEKSSISFINLQKYLDDLYRNRAELSIFKTASICYHNETKHLDFMFHNEKQISAANTQISGISAFLKDIGAGDIEIECVKAKPATASKETAPYYAIPDKPAETFPKKEKYKYSRTKKADYTEISLKDVHDPADHIQFSGLVFKREDRITKAKNTLIQSLSVYDSEDAITVKCFEGRSFSREELESVNEGDRIRVYGRIEFDTYAKDLACIAETVEKLEPEIIVDPAENKRVELHCHTNMSEMDGICAPAEIINYVYNLGHRGVFITDHADVQSFVKAYNAGAKLRKKNPDREFKVGLGCEMNMAQDRLTIVRNADDQKLTDAEYVSFDLETTGLSCYYDHIIEFGAVKIKNQTVIDRKQMFIKPPVIIPGVITVKTKITNEMVAQARSFADSIDEILEWIGDDVLVAHNATFDWSFMNEELRRIGRPALTNTVIDTLDLSRAVLSSRRAYRLGNIARYYRISYDDEIAHRADYDAEALAGVFLCLLKDAAEKGASVIRDLQDMIQGDSAFMKVRRSHICAIVKNQEGIRDMYELVSDSNTKTLAVMGKASGKDGTEVVSEPRVLKSELEKHRTNLLIGSACLNSDVFELACNGDDERLRKAVSFYDYIEIQPLGNYSTYIALGNLPNTARLKAVLKRIIDMADSCGIPVVADSDAHYCRKDQKKFRDVYIMNQGVGGVTHPLYIRDNELRQRTANPDQHIRLTDEMKAEFSWLEDDNLVEKITVDNPNQVFDLIDSVQPIPDGTFPPFIEGSAEKLSKVCYETAKKTYGEPLPEIVEARLKRELKAITEHGYAVNYYISHLLVKKSNADGYLVGSRGSVGSSFVATMSGITEVNALKPHYLCPHCHHIEWIDDPEVHSGFDLPDKECPVCGNTMTGNGHNIPFETFLGFNGDKVPDIDLNFSNEYQAKAHAFTKEVFGEDHVFRAGTIGTVAEKTAFGYVSGYCEKMNITNMRRSLKEYLAKGCMDVKRTTGQHPGGIIVIPADRSVYEFTPVQFPANEPSSEWKTTHFDFHDIHDTVLKFDILGHVDPTAMRLLQNISGFDPTAIPMNDPETLSLFSSDDALKADPRIYHQETGALGLPEFGTRTTRRVLEMTRPKKFSDLVIISGLSHGTDVWAGNAQTLIEQGHKLEEVIGCRDDIMTYLLAKNLEPIKAFKIMEDVRKGRGLTEEYEKIMKEHDVPDWYMESCRKIKYMFPKAHAVAYVIMALRIAWYKVHYPHWFYVQFLTLRCDAYEIETMTKGIEAIRDRMKDIQMRMADRNAAVPVSNKEKSLFDTLEVCEEMYARGYRVGNIDLYNSLATDFSVCSEDEHIIIPPFTCVDGLGANVAQSIVNAREQGKFLSKEDLFSRTQLSQTLARKLEVLGCLSGMQEKNQMSLF